MKANPCLAVLLLLGWSLPAQSPAAEAKPPAEAPQGEAAGRLHFLLLMGQSNTPTAGNPRRLAEMVGKAFSGDEVIIATVRVGACPICGFDKEWPPPEGWQNDYRYTNEVEATGTVWREKVVPAIQKTLGDRKPDTVTMLWMQGERDGRFEYNAKVYKQSLKGVIAQVREHMGREDVNVVIARISDARSDEPCKAWWALVRKSQEEVAEEDPRGTWFDTDDLNGPNNNLHYTDKRGLVRRFAEKAVEVIKK